MFLSAHLSMLFREHPVLGRPAAAAAAGFDCVETWWPGEHAAAWAEETVGLGLAVALVNADGGSIEAGDRGFLNVPGRRAWALEAMHAAVALATACGSPRINVLVGRDTGDEPADAQRERAASVLAECAGIAARAGLAVVVEPLNALDVPGSLLPDAATALELIERVGAPNVELLYDCYHAARAGCDPGSELVELASRIGHVQYADCPGRGAPGTGVLPLAGIEEALLRSGYTGRVGLEFDPRGSTPAALAGLRLGAVAR